MPLFLRISATDWLEHEPEIESWRTEDTIKLAEILATRGVDVLDVSTAGNHPNQKIDMGAPASAYQAVCLCSLITVMIMLRRICI